MNILVPYRWLEEHLETTVTPEEFQKIVSLSGPSVERIHTVAGEPVLDIEVTTNRMDSASIRGIAREGAVILEYNNKPSLMKNVVQYEPKSNDIVHSLPKDFPVRIQNDDAICSRVLAVFMDVKIGESPAWMKKRLEQIGMRPLHNLIDITNYVMAEIGHPTHVFDADRIGKTMMIRESKKGEKLITLDGKEYTLPGGDVVIDNGNGELIDLVGIMGTANSVVTHDTKRILFFIDHADPKRIRKTSMGLAIRTNAAQLNEKMLDPELAMNALLRGIALYQNIAGAKIVSPILDLYPHTAEKRTIRLPLSLTKAYLGIELPEKTHVDILQNLGCEVKKRKSTEGSATFNVTIPTFRPDLEIPVDLVEEIARIYGYHNLPSVLMDTRLPTAYPENTNFALEHEIKQFLASLGCQEVYTYSAVSKTLTELSGYPVKEHVAIQNPLVDEHVYMRRDLLPSLQEILDQNLHKKELTVFEFANTYMPRFHQIPEETMRLAIISSTSHRKAKGIFEALLTRYFVKHVQYQPEDILKHPFYSQRAKLSADGTHIGTLSISKKSRTCIDLSLSALLQVLRKYPEYQTISAFTPIIEDMTFTLPAKTQIGTIIEELRALHPLIAQISLKDVYKQNYTFTATYHQKEKQLENADIQPVRKAIIDVVLQKFNGKLVGNA